MREPALTNVFGFTEQRAKVVGFYEEVLGLRHQGAHEDSVWFEPAGGATFTVHDREDEPRDWGFIPWFHVPDLPAAFARARSKDATVGEMREGYFFARDPDGRVVGVREWR